ncbi:MAG: hypothetical protein AVDCRST_MAG24-137, partial [uncultured Nocardioidaceae bacterium]
DVAGLLRAPLPDHVRDVLDHGVALSGRAV